MSDVARHRELVWNYLLWSSRPLLDRHFPSHHAEISANLRINKLPLLPPGPKRRVIGTDLPWIAVKQSAYWFIILSDRLSWRFQRGTSHDLIGTQPV